MNTDDSGNTPAGCLNCITLTQTFNNAINQLKSQFEQQAEVNKKQAEVNKKHASAIIPLAKNFILSTTTELLKRAVNKLDDSQKAWKFFGTSHKWPPMEGLSEKNEALYEEQKARCVELLSAGCLDLEGMDMVDYDLDNIINQRNRNTHAKSLSLLATRVEVSLKYFADFPDLRDDDLVSNAAKVLLKYDIIRDSGLFGDTWPPPRDADASNAHAPAFYKINTHTLD